MVADIEEHGCQVISVSKSAAGPGWAYTAGVFDTCGQPEIITVGLLPATAHYLLNDAADRLRAGDDLTCCRQAGMIGEVDCEFRPVDRKWVEHLMGWANWYNEGVDYPVLQAIYPDRENRFPGEPGFDPAFAQPLMQPGTPMTAVESDFWASADPDSSLFDWKFNDDPHTRVFLSSAVFERTEPVTYVSHDIEDGAWQFLGDSMTGGKPPMITCLHHVLDDDLTLQQLADLPPGWIAERTAPGEPWVRSEAPVE